VALWPAVKAAYHAATDERYRHYYRQRRIEDLALRERMADDLAGTLPAADLPVPEEAAVLARDGIVPLPPLLTPGQLAEMRDYFERNPCADPYRARLGEFIAPRNAPAETHVAFFSNESVVHAPHALAAANDPRVLAIVSSILGAKPTISYMTAWWSLPGRGDAEHAELFHRDYDDLRFIKLFLYLTDVDENAGPHNFVRGSHRRDKMLARIRFSEEEVAANYPAEDRLRLVGKVGTTFLENTFGLHRGIPPVSKPRLIFQILYSLCPYIGGPRRPLRSVEKSHEGMRLDPYINRSYCTVI
jgi:hypothetical protein